MSLINLLGRGFGTPSPPATPTLTFTDAQDGTGGTATIAGSAAGATNRVYYASRTGGSWTLGGTRSGNGDVALTLAVGGYVAFVIANLAGAYSVSALVTLTVTDLDTAESPLTTVSNAIVADLTAGLLVGAFSRSFTPRKLRRRWWKQDVELATLRVDVAPLRAVTRQATRDHVDSRCEVALIVRYKFPAADLDAAGDVPEAYLDALSDFFVEVQSYLLLHEAELGIADIQEETAGDDDAINQLGQYTGVARITVDVGGT